MKQHYLQILQQTIAGRAEKTASSFALNPPGILEFSLQMKASGSTSQAEQTPFLVSHHNKMQAISVGDCTVLLAVLSEPVPDHGELRSYYTLAAQARGSLGIRDADLYMFLIGPAGTKTEEAWQRLASSIERDESICRKLVWLPSAEAELDNIRREAEHFCDRTFLASPWSTDQEFAQHELDAINAIYEKLREGFSSHTALPENVLKKWLRILEKAEEPQRIAQLLFESSKARP